MFALFNFLFFFKVHFVLWSGFRFRSRAEMWETPVQNLGPLLCQHPVLALNIFTTPPLPLPPGCSVHLFCEFQPHPLSCFSHPEVDMVKVEGLVRLFPLDLSLEAWRPVHMVWGRKIPDDLLLDICHLEVSQCLPRETWAPGGEGPAPCSV